jgi:ankyrin repeat protein
LKEHGQDFNEVTPSNWTALHIAADRSQVECVIFLLENGTKKGMKTKAGGKLGGLSAKAMAEFQKKPEIAALL